MAFTVYVPRKIKIDPLEDGQGSLDKAGNGRFLSEDLELVGIVDAAVVLTDEGTLRLALRKPRPDETGKTMAVSHPMTGKKVDKTRAHIRLTGALKELRLEPAAVKGRYDLTTKDDLLIFNLAGVATGEGDDEEDGDEGDEDDGGLEPAAKK